MICSFQDFEQEKICQDRNFILLVSMINSKHVYFYWGGSFTLWTPPMHIFWGVQTPPTPPGIDAPAGRSKNLDQTGNPTGRSAQTVPVDPIGFHHSSIPFPLLYNCRVPFFWVVLAVASFLIVELNHQNC